MDHSFGSVPNDTPPTPPTTSPVQEILQTSLLQYPSSTPYTVRDPYGETLASLRNESPVAPLEYELNRLDESARRALIKFHGDEERAAEDIFIELQNNSPTLMHDGVVAMGYRKAIVETVERIARERRRGELGGW